MAKRNDIVASVKALFPELQLNGHHHAKKRAFLLALAHCGKITEAAHQAGIDRVTQWLWRKADAKFDAAVEYARTLAIERLEDAMITRAVDGIEKGVYHQGELVGKELQYSDTLAIFLAKNWKPERYGERIEVKNDVTDELKRIWLELRDHPEVTRPRSYDAEGDVVDEERGPGGTLPSRPPHLGEMDFSAIEKANFLDPDPDYDDSESEEEEPAPPRLVDKPSEEPGGGWRLQ